MKKETIMTRQRLEHMIRLGAKKLQDPYYQGSAAEIAFYLLLSIVPTLILLSQVLGLFSVSLDSIREWLNPDLIHVEGADMILSMLDYSPSGVNSVFLALTAVWAASRAQFTMLRITNYTLSDGHSTGMGYVRDRIGCDHGIHHRFFAGDPGLRRTSAESPFRYCHRIRDGGKDVDADPLAHCGRTVLPDDLL